MPALLDGNNLRRQVRIWLADYDESGTHGTPTDPCWPDAMIDRKVEEVAGRYCEAVEPRTQRIAASTSGLTMTGLFTDTIDAPLTIAEIVGAEYSTGASSATVGIPMERIEVHEALAALSDLSFGIGSGAPYRWAVERMQTDTEADQGKWRFWLDQQHDSSGGAVLQIILIARLTVAAIGGSTGTPDCSANGSYIIAQIAAYELSMGGGETPEFAAHILNGISDKVLEQMQIKRLAKKPRVREMERVA